MVLCQLDMIIKEVIMDVFKRIMSKAAEWADFGVDFDVLKAMAAIKVVARVTFETFVAETAADHRDFLLLHHWLVLFANDVRRGVA